MRKQILRGEIYLASFNPPTNKRDSEQRGYRPVLVVQNHFGNVNSPTAIVAAMTSNLEKAELPTHVTVNTDCGVQRDSIILLEQLRTLDKRKLNIYVGSLDENQMKEVDAALAVSLGIGV